MCVQIGSRLRERPVACTSMFCCHRHTASDEALQGVHAHRDLGAGSVVEVFTLRSIATSTLTSKPHQYKTCETIISNTEFWP
eukprot:5794669-Amphidinium_carterae.1